MQYFTVKKNNMKKSYIVYKCLPKPVYVHPREVISPKFKVTYIRANILISLMVLRQHLKNCLCSHINISEVF